MLQTLMDPALLARDLVASRALLGQITQLLEGAQWLGPELAIVNPPLWELGHLGWFQERWCLRWRNDGGLDDSLLSNSDAFYDSALVAHATRWHLPLPGVEATRGYLEAVLERTLNALEHRPDDANLQYFVRLATFHEDMHAEAFLYSRQTLGYSDPFAQKAAAAEAGPAMEGDVTFEGGEFLLGATPQDGFVFDNEKWAHAVTLAPFRMARRTVSNAEFAEFVDAGGYRRHEWWSDDGWKWRTSSGYAAPNYWQKVDRAWRQRRFDQIEPLWPHQPVVHINWHEAQAYCNFAGRRLPTEAEWEYAATLDAAAGKRRYPWGDAAPDRSRANLDGHHVADVAAHSAGDSAQGVRQMLGNVWEWTASAFDAYPGFVVDPYKEYSQPWFGTHKVLRGGSFITPGRLMRNTWRNFYMPERNDIFAGFRTCAND
jgi:iron(II)-dependent oxidoreductase